jgi:3-oxoadipate enol-lactonase
MSSVEVHYELSGPSNAPVVVFAGSLGSSLRMWDPQADALSGQFRVLRYDHRGHGESPSPEGPYAISELAGDVLALLDRLGIERVAFCGLSLGGMVGIWLGAHAQQRLTSLTLCCTSAHFDDPAPWLDRAAAVRAEGTASIAAGVVERWFTPDWAARHNDVVQRAAGMIYATPDEGYASCAEAIADWDGRDLLGRIIVPTLVIAGARDPATPVAPYAETIAAGVPRARLEVLDAAHLATIERARQASALIGEHAAG